MSAHVMNVPSRKTSRCVRQRDYPFSKRCLCQLRRSPIQRVDGGSRFQTQHFGRQTIAPPEVTTERPADPTTFPTLRPTEEEHISDNRVLAPGNVCEQRGGDETCNRNCKQDNKTRFADSDLEILKFFPTVNGSEVFKMK